MQTLTIGRESAGFIRRGHPWVRRDRYTKGLEGLTAGEPVILVDERGARIAGALADPADDVCARVFARDPAQLFDPAGATERAWSRRGRFHGDRQTDCYRLIHGEADGLPGLRAERYGDVIVVLVQSACGAPHADTVARTLATRLPTAQVVIRDHLDDLRREEVHSRLLHGDLPPADTACEGREFGVRLALTPFAGLATGIYVDQRGTRRWLRARCAEWRVLNLFAYTGLFSLSLLQAGAASAVDVDLAGPALDRARATATLNGLADRHRIAQVDCAAFLQQDQGIYDLICCDPPTAALGGDGWVARRDYPALLRLALARLAPGGAILIASNTQGGKPLDLPSLLAGAGTATSCPLEPLEGPELDPDIPQIPGFPEGRPYRLAVARRT